VRKLRAYVQLEGDFSIIPRKANEILRSQVKQTLLRTVHLKLCWATPRTALNNRHGSGEEVGSEDVPIEAAHLEGQLAAAVTEAEVFTALNDYENCAQSADYASMSDEEKQDTLLDFKSEIAEGRNLSPDAWTPAALLRAGVVYQKFDHGTGDFASYYMDALRAASTTEELLLCIDHFREMYVSSTFAALPAGAQQQLLSDMKAAAVTARVRVTSEVWTPAVVQAYASALGAANAIVPRIPYAAL
jgi:hypothetical protein